jgi:hypothetical protein
MPQAGRLQVRDPMRCMIFINLPNPSSHTSALGFTQPITEMGTKIRKIIFFRARLRQARKADIFTAISEPIVYTIWDNPASDNRPGLHGLLRR